MAFRSYTSQAIVLQRRNFSEADRMLILFTKHYGKLSFLAKGVRRPKSKKRGSIEIFSKIKFSAAKGRNFDILTEVELLDPHLEIRNSLKKSAVCYYFVEIVRRIVQEGDRNEELYEYLLMSIDNLKVSQNLRKLKQEFVHNVLIILGYWPKDKLNKNPEAILEEVLEHELLSKRVGKLVLS